LNEGHLLKVTKVTMAGWEWDDRAGGNGVSRKLRTGAAGGRARS
jgi:hypothetical protein